MNSLENIESSLLFLYVKELRLIAQQLLLCEKGNKMTLIQRIIHFLKTGEKLSTAQFPFSSCAQKKHTYPISPTTLMLKGAYKNDLKTRIFFQNLIGPHFHFTAFGIDWLYERWFLGTPPTYSEFATMWQKEYAQRKAQKVPPKKEWAYINFVQKFLNSHPSATQSDLNKAWKAERNFHKELITNFLKTVIPDNQNYF